MIVDQLAMLFSIILLLSVVTTGAFAVLSQGQIAAYDRDGYLVAHGLLDVTDLASAVTAAEESSPKRPGYFSSVQSGPMFGESSKAFRDAALYSQLPTAVAELMKLDGKQETIRVLR